MRPVRAAMVRSCVMRKVVCPSASRQIASITEDFAAVEPHRGLVEDQDGRAAKRRAGDGNLLALPGRERRAALGDLGVVAVGLRDDEAVGVGQPRRRLDLAPREPRGRRRATP